MKEESDTPRALWLICGFLLLVSLGDLLALGLDLKETVSWKIFFLGIAWSLALATGLIYRLKMAIILTIFWLCLIGVISASMFFLTAIHMFPIKYMTTEKVISNGITLLSVFAAFAAARWLSGPKGQELFDAKF